MPGQNGRGPSDGTGGTLPQQMSQLDPLGLQVGGVVVAGVDHQRHPIFHPQAIATKAGDLAWVVGDQAQALHPQITEDLGPNSVVAQVSGKPQPLIGLHGVQAAILKRIGLQLVDQTNAAPFLAQIHHHSLTCRLNHAQGGFELGAAVTAQGAKGVTGKALRMDPHQHRSLGLGWMAFDDRHMFAAIELVAIADGPEAAEVAGQVRLRLAAHEAFGIEPVADQVGDTYETQSMPLGVGRQLGQSGHGAIAVLDLTDHPGRV